MIGNGAGLEFHCLFLWIGGAKMKDYGKRVAMLASDTQITTKDVDVDQLIIDNTAQKKVDETTDILYERLRNVLKNEINSILAPRFTFENVSESGIMICGKEGNIATAKNTFFEIFNAFCSACSEKQFKESTRLAGRKSALQFSDDFRKMLTIDNVTQLPNSEEKFMNLYSKFDCRSAWWEEPIDYFESGTANEPYISAIIKKPFISYPWIEQNSGKNNLFLQGYIQTLFNCSSDILRVIGEAKGVKIGERKMALKVVAADEPDQEKEYLQIYCTDAYIEQWMRIDQMIYSIVSFLISAKDKEDIVELVVMIEELKDVLLGITGIEIVKETDYEKIITTVQKTLRDVEADKFRLHFLLNDIRILYEDYRLEKLSNH